MTTDPFDSLREPNVPLAPRPAFAADLPTKFDDFSDRKSVV